MGKGTAGAEELPWFSVIWGRASVLGRGQGPQDHAEEARGCGSHGLYLAGSWSCRTPGTSTCSNRSGGRIWAAATSPALPVPRPTANPSSCTASLGSSAFWLSAFSSPAWWPPWSCGGTATGATRRPPKRSVPRVLLLLSAAQRRESPTGWGFFHLVLTRATCVETAVSYLAVGGWCHLSLILKQENKWRGCFDA